MSVKSGHLAQLLLIQRERDALRETNCKLRDKLLDLAKQCDKCGGTGCVTKRWLDEYFKPREQGEDCPKCHDIREVLGQ